MLFKVKIFIFQNNLFSVDSQRLKDKHHKKSTTGLSIQQIFHGGGIEIQEDLNF